jgi:hypothetical protein
MLDLRVGIAFDDFLDLKSSFAEVLRNLLRTKKEEIDAHLVPPPFVQMNGLVANVKGNEQSAARSQHSVKFGKSLRQIAARNVDDRVKRGDARPSSVGRVECQHVAWSKLDGRSQATGLLDHRRRQVDSTNVDPLLMQVPSDVTRAATQVARRSDTAHAVGEPVEQLPIERLVLQLVEDAPDVFVRDEVIARPVISLAMSVHRSAGNEAKVDQDSAISILSGEIDRK